MEDYWFCCKNLRLKQGIFSLPNRCFLHNVVALKLSSTNAFFIIRTSGVFGSWKWHDYDHHFLSSKHHFTPVFLYWIVQAFALIIVAHERIIAHVEDEEPKEVNTPPYPQPKCQRSWFLLLHRNQNICWGTSISTITITIIIAISQCSHVLYLKICSAHLRLKVRQNYKQISIKNNIMIW